MSMQAESTVKPEPDTESPSSTVPVNVASDGASPSANGNGVAQDGTVKGQFPPPKTDKPRPHVCTTCGRSFARLEHLKRHERSHTKEKPFECPECTRCFARRDLLLRHQQKLHMTGATTRPRNGRRESVAGTSGNTSGKVRKNSVANMNMGGPNGMAGNGVRPRANTISHLDISGLDLMGGQNPQFHQMNPLGLGMHQHNMMGGVPNGAGFAYRGMSTAMGHHGNMHGLPKLDTQHINHLDMTNSLRTAPPQAGNFGGFDIDQLFTPHTTINPAALHFGSAGQISSTNIPFGLDLGTNQQVPIEDDFMWMRHWATDMKRREHENAVEESSPSRMSSGDSPGDYSEMANSQAGMPMQNNFQWQPQDLSLQQTISNTSQGPFQLDALGSGLPSLEANGTLSPISLQDPTPTGDTYFHQAMMHQNGQRQLQHDVMLGLGANFFGNPLSNLDSSSPSMSSSSMTGSARQSSVTSMSTDSITDSTRQALLNSLNQPSALASATARKYSQPSVSSPLSPGAGLRPSTQANGPTLPVTADIRKYIQAFMQFAHPHLPVTHIATLSFESIESAASAPTPTPPPTRGSPLSSSPTQTPATGGARCLILGMAAIGALYEYDHPASKELFEAAKKMIQLYLEERRKADMYAAVNGARDGGETPLWLVQAMLLTVIYGHHCGDRIAADIASNHIAALVSLARAANLAHPQAENGEPGTASESDDLQTQWLRWAQHEERKRSFFAIFTLSSLLTTAYNQTPTIMNSEILLDLPCEEELYNASSAEEWQKLGGLAAVQATSVPFSEALSTLLTANQRQGNDHAGSAYNSSSRGGAVPGDVYGENDIRPSTFGCLVLINALHNYIWETRSRHRGREWTMQETESMVTHIEPALNAWQAAWKANEHHRLERPNPFGKSPLAADSIPLLDLAFVRLYVNLGRTAEAFWRRDFDAMAQELGNGDLAVLSPTGKDNFITAPKASMSKPTEHQSIAQRRLSHAQASDPATSRRERHLRKAAYYAADSLTIACSYNLTYSDATAHELPIQSAICFFDCVQVLAEWATTIQERAGRYLGVLGRDAIDYAQVPAIMLLETEDVELLRKIEQICNALEQKRLQQENLLGMDMNGYNTTAHTHNGVDLNSCGIGSKVLRVTAMMLEKAVIWPITHVMAKALETEAAYMDQRAQASCTS